MPLQQLGPLHLVLFLVSPWVTSGAFTTPFFNQWNTGFEAKVCVSTDVQVCGFEATISFSGLVTNFNAHNFAVNNPNAQTSTVYAHSQTWNQDFAAGADICLKFNTNKVSSGSIQITDVVITKTSSDGNPCPGSDTGSSSGSNDGNGDRNSGDVSATYRSRWQSGFVVLACTTTSVQLCGWQAKVSFSHDVTNVEAYNFIVTSSSDLKTYHVKNEHWTADVLAGGQVCLDFKADTAHGNSATVTGIEITPTGTCSGDVSATYRSRWQSGFVVLACTTTSVQLCGWQAKISFSHNVTNVEAYNFIVTSSSDLKTYHIKNEHWTAGVLAGGQVCLDFKADTAHGNSATVTGIEITPTGTCSGGGGSGTETTKAAATTTKAAATTTKAAATTTKAATATTKVATPTAQGTTQSSSDPFNLGDVLGKSILFYEAQRSGDLPPSNRVSWRGDSTLDDGSDNFVDLSGGWFDGKLVTTSNSTSLWLGQRPCSPGAWFSLNLDIKQLASSQMRLTRWSLDYFLKCWDEGERVYWAQVGDGDLDHGEWNRPEDLDMFRPSYAVSESSPGSEVAGETAAAFAAASIAFRDEDNPYSTELLANAESLFEFANTFKGSYTSAIPNISKFYNSFSGYNDELCWTAAWLYKATGESRYKDIAMGYLSYNTQSEFSWDNKNIGCQLLMYSAGALTGSAIEAFMNTWMTKQTTPCGLAWHSEWSPLRYSANAALIALMAAEEGINPTQYREWALSQIDYMLGANKDGRSYVVGFGNNFPTRPHHRASSCPADPAVECTWDDFNKNEDNPNILTGALIGGPDQNGDFTNDRSNYRTNEVACDYNAGFQSAVAGFLDLKERNVQLRHTNNC